MIEYSKKPFRQKSVPDKEERGDMPTTWREYFMFLNSLQQFFPEQKTLKKATKTLSKPASRKE